MRSARYRRLLASSALGVLALTMGPAVLAGSLPSGGVVAAGQAQIGQSSPTAITIQQQSSRAIINWDGFSVGQGQSVQFNNGAGATLNRVTGQQGSAIDGLLSATGSIYLINPNGVIIGKTGIVNVGGTFVAATQNVLDSQFMAGGDLTFSGSSTAAVINYGKIGSLGGDVALIASKVDNEGEIDAPNGDVGLVSGYTVIMRDMALDSGKFAVQVGGPDTSATNAGQIKAAEAELRANGGNVYALAGNTASVIKADGVAVNDGKVFLVADGGTVNVSGTTVEASASDGSGGQIAVTGQTVSVDATTVLDASATSTTAVKSGGAIKVNADAALSFKGTALARGGAAGGDGGSVETSGATVDFDGASVDTTAANGLDGNWLIDPYDLTVTATAASTISTSLATGNVTLQTTATGTTGAGTANANGVGDININAAISWSANHTLTLNAYRNININAAITAGGSPGVSLLYGQGAVAAGNTATYNVAAPVNLKGGTIFSTKLGSNGTTVTYTVLTALGAQGSGSTADLQGISGSLTTNYVLGANIDASATATWNRSGSVYQGFSPLGSSGIAFKGIFDGLGHTISNLNINRSSTSYAGLFGNSSGTIQNVSLIGGSVTGSSYVGALVGKNTGVLNNVSASTAVTSTASSSQFVGGLAGYSSTAIVNGYATGAVSSNGNDVGGLVGYSTVAIAGDYATGTVSGNSVVGGLVGYSNGGISNSNATGNVTGSNQYVGGLTGNNTGGAISNSFAKGTVSGYGYVGGLVGKSLGSISGSYASGNVTGTDSWVGGLAGYSGGGIASSNASGTVIGNSQYAGGLTGYNTGGAITNSSATGTVTGYDYVGGLAGESLTSISGSYATGKVTSTDNWVGGLTGYSGGGISDSNASGTVIGGNIYAGGLTGYNTGGNISNSFATGSVSGAIQYVGGLVGYNDFGATISNSNASGAVSGRMSYSSYIGGLAGYSLGDINGSYATGNVTGSASDIGGLAGYSGGNINSSYATGNVLGGNYVGGLSGESDASVTIGNSFATGTVSGDHIAGGLVGYGSAGLTISGSYATGAVSGTTGVGGLIGVGTGINISASYATGAVTGTSAYTGGLAGDFDTGAMTDVYATGAVTNTGAVAGGAYTGGLVGYLGNTSAITTVTNAYATGNVTAGPAVGGQTGGLIGAITYGASVTNAYATGNVIGTTYTGGLVGENDDTILNAYATGSVTGTTIVGGLVGTNYSHITNTYSTGLVSGTSGVGGLIGSDQYSTVTSSYWNTQTSGQSTSANGTPLTTAQFQTLSTFTNGGWSIDDQGGTSAIWRIYDGQTAPLLRSFMTTLDLSGGSHTAAYNGTTQTLALPVGTDPTLITVASGLHAGTYQSASVQQGYDIIGGLLTITSQAITITAAPSSKVYNGTTAASATPTVTSGTLYDTASLSESYAGKDVGSTIKLTPTATIANASDYAVTYVSSNLGVITPATLTASLTGTVSKVYNDSTAASLTSSNYSLSGIVAGDSVSLNGPTSGAYDTVHAGTGKTVSVTGLTLANNAAGDYVLAASSLSAAIGTITPEAITVTATANSKVYDGTTVASATPTVTSGTLYDTATLSESYASKDVGSTIALTPTAAIANAGDYNVTYVSSNLGVITPATLTASLTGTVSKVYNNSTAATLASGNYTLTGIVAGDSISLNGPATGTYDTVHAGSGKTVSVTGLTLANNTVGDYVLAASSLSAAIGTITPEAITVTASSNSKVYDGTTTASATPTVTSGTLYDTATLSETYAGNNVGNTIALTPTATIANAGDYAVTYASSNLGVITPATLTASLTGTVSKVYNNSTAATLASGNYSLTGIVAGDSVSLNGPTSGTYDTVHSGTGKTVSVTGLTLANNAAGDYVLAASSLSAAIGTITPEAITVTATANSKVYDGTTTASATPTVTSGTLYDTATLSESYAGKDVGSTIALTPTATIANAGDYNVTYVASNLGVITPATVTASLTGTVSKVYNDSTVATLASGNYSLTGVVAGDSTSLNGPTSGAYDTVHAGTGKTVSVTGLTLANNTAGDYVLAASSLSAAIGTITPEAITVTASSNSKVYDGTTTASATPTVTSGTLYDTATLSETYAGKDVGSTIALTPTATIANAGDYAVTYVSSNLGVITPATLTASLTGTVSKVYNNSAAATLASGNYSLTGIVAGDSVSLNGPTSGTYDTVHAGTGKTVSVTGLTLANNAAGDYVLAASSLSAAIGTITPEAITVTATANSKVYDGTTAASATPTVTSGTLYDTATLSESYAGKDVSNTIALTPTATIANAGDYNVTYVASNLGVITPATVTASLTGTVSKVYNDSTVATLASGNYSLTGVVAGDSTSLNGPTSGAYDTVHAGTGKTVSVTGLTLANNTAGDYVLAASSLSAAIGTITPEAITVTASSNSKVYDGTTTASATPTVTSGTLYDTATLSESYAGKDVGNTIALTPTATIANAGDYAVTYVSSNLGVITPATLTASLTGTVSKVYNNSTAATLASGNYSLTGIVAGDSVSLNGPASGTYDTAHAGTGKTVSVTGLTLANNTAGDYVLAASSLSAAIGTITPEAITVTATANSKVYDGTTTASATPTVTSGTLYDTATLSESYAGKDVGNTIALTPTATIANAGDYNVTYVAANLGVITPATLTATVTGTITKTYDSNYVAPVISGALLSLSGVVSGDSVSLTAPTAAQYDTPNVGTGKKVGATGYTLTGASAGDYTVNTYAFGNVGTITPEAITITATANSKVYNGTTAATATPTVTSGTLYDTATLSETYASKNVGNAITLTPTATIANAGNYAVTYASTNLGVITPATLTASLTGTVSKVYNGSTAATLASGNYSLSGVVAGDSVSLNGPTSGTYDTVHAGTGKTVSVTGLTLANNTAGDYVLAASSLAAAIGTITPEAITVTATANSKVYNGTVAASATPTVTSGTLYDTATLSETYASKDVGSAIKLTPTATIANAGDYNVTYVASNLGVITPATLTAAVTGTVEKTYDGNYVAPVTAAQLSLSGVISGDSVSLTAPTAAQYDTPNAGTGKKVGATGYSLTGASAGDYTVNSYAFGNVGIIDPKALTASITGTIEKTYSGNNFAIVPSSQLALAGVVSGDSVGVTASYSNYDNASAGTGKTVYATGLTLTGSSAANYTVSYYTTGNVGIIDPKALTASLTGTVSKTYDGTTTATLSAANYTISGIVTGDQVGITTTAGTYATKNAGNNIAVTVNGLQLGGAQASDYKLTVPSLTASIGVITPQIITFGPSNPLGLLQWTQLNLSAPGDYVLN